MNQHKLSQYFFIIAAVVAILDGAFELDETMQSIKFVLLVFSGIMVGALRHREQKEFLLSGVAVIITGFILTQILEGSMMSFSIMIYNFVIFLSAAVVVVGIEEIANIITFDHKDELPTEEHVKAFKQLSPQDIKHLTFERVWGIIILFAVALTFIVLLAQSFFDVTKYADIFLATEILITILFIIDVVILYEKSTSLSNFFHYNFFDIVAAIPAIGVLRGLKLIRAVRIIRAMRGSMHLTKLTKLYKTTKFFSEESYFNEVNQPTPSLPKKRTPQKSVTTKKKPKTATSKKTSRKTPSKRTTSKKRPLLKKNVTTTKKAKLKRKR